MKRRGLLVASMGLPAVAGCIEEFVGGDEERDEYVVGVGDIDVVIDEKPVNLSADRFQAEFADDYAMEFHFHEFDDHWYMEGDRPVTVAEGLEKLPEFSYQVRDAGDRLQIDGATYDGGDPGVTIEVRVNDEAVPPADYVLEDGDAIVVEVQTGSTR